MSPFPALLKREWLESRTTFLWLPLGLLGLVLVASLLGLAVSGSIDSQIVISGDQDIRFLGIDGWSDAELAARLASLRLAVSAPFWLLYMLGAAFVLLGCLYDERKDRSVLFFKSVPVSDAETVLSKLAMVICVAPLITVTIVLCVQLLGLTMLSFLVAAQDWGDASRLWWQSGIVGSVPQLLLGYLLQGLWSLPVFAWLMLVSAVVPRLPLLWALLVPFSASLVERIVFGTSMISTSISTHLRPAGLSAEHEGARVALSLGDQLSLFATAELWVGLALGAALLYGAIRFRSINNEL